MYLKKIFAMASIIVLAAAIANAGEITVPGTGILITPPAGYTQGAASGDMLLLFMAPPMAQDFKASLSVSKDPLEGKAGDAWLAEYKAGLSKQMTEFKIIQESNVNLGGKENGSTYTVIEFRGTIKATPLHWLQAIHFQAGYAWIFSGMTRESYATIHAKQFKSAFSSIYFPPAPPEGFRAQALSETQVILTWNPVQLARGGFEIQRADSTGVWQTVAKAAPGSVTYTDTLVDCGLDVKYRIRCLNAKGNSDWSAEAQATLQVCPAATGEVPIQIQ